MKYNFTKILHFQDEAEHEINRLSKSVDFLLRSISWKVSEEREKWENDWYHQYNRLLLQEVAKLEIELGRDLTAEQIVKIEDDCEQYILSLRFKDKYLDIFRQRVIDLKNILEGV